MAGEKEISECLRLFDLSTADWFKGSLGKPTPVQAASWPAIAAGGHVLVSAPTGTGKTLSAFLVFLDKLKKMAVEGCLKQELYLLYVSPLKSLAADIRENLKRPLAGIGGESLIRTAIRTGDTTQQERRQMVKKPPHILITTPESLYLMLTSKTGQNMLCTAQAVIIDELHALIDTKRGAHLMLSIARLDGICGRPLQRIGLSATISPLSAAARYLAPEPVFIAAPPMDKKVRLQVLGSYVDAGKRRKDPIWQELSALVYRYCQGSKSVIAFVEGRRYAEKLAYYVNLIGGEGFARVHHGSLSKEQRMETETALREGRLRLLCATSSMELGIDVGEIGQVLQVGCPRTVSGTMQRLGRAGHNPDRVSVMYLFPRTAAESILCGMTSQLAREGKVEKTNPPEGCFDVLAQHLVSMAAFKSYEVDDVMELLPRAWPFRKVTKEDVKSLLRMLAGDYEHQREIPARPRVLYDRIHEKVEGDGYSRMLAISAGGTIPDKGLYTVRTEEGVKVGEADEEFVYETQVGDRFILGAFAWKVVHIGRDTVTVAQAPAEGARLPFWKGELKGRGKETGELFGKILGSLQQAQEDGRLKTALLQLGLDEPAAEGGAEYLNRQIKATGGLPTDRTILVEHFRDQSGNSQLMVHSVFGRRVNAPLSLLAVQAAKEDLGMEVGSVDEEDGFLLYSYGNRAMPEGLLQRIDPDTSEHILSALLPAMPIFNMAFRYNCGRALMMGAKGSGRQPLWMQRLRSAEMLEQVVRKKEHPLIRETRRECMEQLWDAKGVRQVLEQIRCGGITVREIYTETPSPMSLPLQWSQEAAVMYDYAPTPRGIYEAVEEALMQEKDLLRPGDKELSQVQLREKLPEDEKQLHSLLMTEGDLAAGELEVPVEWLEKLSRENRVVYLEQGLWIAAEHWPVYQAALGLSPEEYSFFEPDTGGADAGKKNGIGQGEQIPGPVEERPGKEEVWEKKLAIVRRMLRYRGGAGIMQIARRYGWEEGVARAVLEELCRRGEVVCQRQQREGEKGEEEKEGEEAQEGKGEKEDKREKQEGSVYYHGQLYKRARRKTLKKLREEISTRPSSAYASLLLSRVNSLAPPEEGIRTAIAELSGMSFSAAFWEEQLLPQRVRNYREGLLDGFLAKGEFFWHMKDGRVGFDPADRINWEEEPKIDLESLSDQERLIVVALVKRGASFMQAFNSMLSGEPLYDTLLSLMEKGIVCADSFLPVRQWLNKEKLKKSAVRVRVGARVKALQAGRWDLVRPVLPLSLQEQMERCFGRYQVLCRETASACNLPWQEALSILRVQEYTGQVRRGYFVEGLSGTQFIRKEDFGGVMAKLGCPDGGLAWISAADPMQPWGKLLAHQPELSFANLPGTAVALRGGCPVALFERQGKVFRVFEPKYCKEALQRFVECYQRGQIFADKKCIQVREYPDGAAEIFVESGFGREVRGYSLYRS